MDKNKGLRRDKKYYFSHLWCTLKLRKVERVALSQFSRLASFPRGILELEQINFERDARINRLQAV